MNSAEKHVETRFGGRRRKKKGVGAGEVSKRANPRAAERLTQQEIIRNLASFYVPCTLFANEIDRDDLQSIAFTSSTYMHCCRPCVLLYTLRRVPRVGSRGPRRPGRVP